MTDERDGKSSTPSPPRVVGIARRVLRSVSSLRLRRRRGEGSSLPLRRSTTWAGNGLVAAARPRASRLSAVTIRALQLHVVVDRLAGQFG